MDNRYYWIKLYVGFMDSDAVDFLMGQKNGAEYVVLYQKLCFMTIKTGGELSRQIGNILVPYDIEKIQRDCKHFSIDTVRIALELYIKLGLIYEQENGIFKIANYEKMVGSETKWAEYKRKKRIESDSPKALTSAERVAKHREKKRNECNEICNEKCNENSVTCNEICNENSVTNRYIPAKKQDENSGDVGQCNDVGKCPKNVHTEIDIDIEIYNNINIKKKKKQKKENSDTIKAEMNSFSLSLKNVVDYLNSKCGTAYSYNNLQTQQFILERLSEGYTVDDLIAVIDNQSNLWSEDAKMKVYLRPSTLFRSSNFENYYNAMLLARAEAEEEKKAKEAAIEQIKKRQKQDLQAKRVYELSKDPQYKKAVAELKKEILLTSKGQGDAERLEGLRRKIKEMEEML